VEARSDGERVAPLERLAVMVGLRDRHAGPDGVAGPQERSQVGREGDPEGGDQQMVCARDGSSSPLEVVSRATVSPAHRVRKWSLVGSDGWFMSVGLLGVLGPSLMGGAAYLEPHQRINGW
jgi:hypothetical protein